jgi:cell pole-organizing protein PopZ
MEEILASIRRIIADDDSTESSSRASDPANSPPRAAAALPRMVPPAAAPEPATRDEEIDLMLARLHGESRSEPASEEPAPTQRLAEPPAHANRLGEAFERRAPDHHAPRTAGERRGALEEDSSLISAVTTAAVKSNFNTLAQAVHAPDGRTVEELVSDLLRPMLKAWLDENLPSMVEDLVRAEIERVSRGKR